METRNRANRARLNAIVRCPGCDREHYKCLYDWQFIYCNDCGTYFEKHTGNRIECDRPPKQYWRTDSETPNGSAHGRGTASIGDNDAHNPKR